MLTNYFGLSRPVEPPRSSRDAYVGRVCHCRCGGDCCSRHPVRLVLVNGSLGCRTIAARTRDLIRHTLAAFTDVHSILPSNTKTFQGIFTLLWEFLSQVQVLP